MQAITLLCLLALAPFARTSELIIAASQATPALQRFVEDLAKRRPQDRLRLVQTAELPPPTELSDDSRLVLLGEEALDWRLRTSKGPPTVILQVSRVAARKRLGDSQPPRLTLLWSDPPIDRQLRLIRQMLPRAQRIGVLYSDDSRFLIDEVRRQSDTLGLVPRIEYWPDTSDSRSLSRLLEDSEVLFGLDDSALYNPSTIKAILLASYGHQLPLIGPTAAFIRAGSLTSTYSDQQDWLQTLDELLSLPPAHWPRQTYPRHFKVLSNPQVARSLTIAPGDDAEQAARLRRQEDES